MLQTVLCVSYERGSIKRNGDKSRPIACSGQKQGGGVTQSKMNWDVNCKFTFLLLRNTSLYLQGILLYLVLGHIRQHLRGKTLSMFSPPPNILIWSLARFFCHCWPELTAWVENSRGEHYRNLGCNREKMCVNRCLGEARVIFGSP